MSADPVACCSPAAHLLLTVARNRLRDHWRSAATRTGVPLDPEAGSPVHLDETDVDAVGDRRLELMLVCAHPAIASAVRTPLMLNVVLGVSAEQIGRAFAVPTSTMAARLVWAKRKIAAAGIPFVIPDRAMLPERMNTALEAVYGSFAGAWRTTGPQERATLAWEALHLAETLVTLAPDDAEARGLAWLMCLSRARQAARLDDHGRFVPLAEQVPARWNPDLIERALALTHDPAERANFVAQGGPEPLVRCRPHRVGGLWRGLGAE